MKTRMYFTHFSLIALATFFLGTHASQAGRGGGRAYGVSAESAGRGTHYEGSRGGEAYVGPRGAAVQGPNGGTAAASRYTGAAVASGPNGAVAARGRYGNAAAVGPEGGAAVAGPRGAAAVGPNGNVAVAAAPVPAVRRYPVGYTCRTLPAGYRAMVAGGVTYYYADGVYYQPQFQGGNTVYVVVDI